MRKRALGIVAMTAFAIAAVGGPVAANSDTATDTYQGVVPTGVACQFPASFASMGVVGVPTDQSLHRWHGDSVELTCWFKGLDMSSWDGTTLVTGFACAIAPNPDSPGQGPAFTNDTSLRINAQGNAVVRCHAML